MALDSAVARPLLDPVFGLPQAEEQIAFKKFIAKANQYTPAETGKIRIRPVCEPLRLGEPPATDHADRNGRYQGQA
jgi:hypothetical protein